MIYVHVCINVTCVCKCVSVYIFNVCFVILYLFVITKGQEEDRSSMSCYLGPPIFLL